MLLPNPIRTIEKKKSYSKNLSLNQGHSRYFQVKKASPHKRNKYKDVWREAKNFLTFGLYVMLKKAHCMKHDAPFESEEADGANEFPDNVTTELADRGDST